MAWYDDLSRTEFEVSYANTKQLQRDMEFASRRGWKLLPSGGTANQQAASTDSGSALRQPGSDKITVTFFRSPEWIAEREREVAENVLAAAVRSADDREAHVVKAQSALAAALETFDQKRAWASVAEGAIRHKAEKELLDALKVLVNKRRLHIKALAEAVKVMPSAIAVGASEFSGILARYQRAQALGNARLEAELQLLREQEAVTRAAEQWRKADANRRKVEESLRKEMVEFERRDAQLAAGIKLRDEAINILPPLD